MYKGYKDIYDVRGNGKDYNFGDVVQVAGQKGKVKWTNSARILFEQTEMWNNILEQNDKLACVGLFDGNEIFLVFGK